MRSFFEGTDGYCAFLFWYRYALPFLYHGALAELVSSLPCSIMRWPSWCQV